LQDGGVTENCISGQIAASKGKQILGLFGWDLLALDLNTKKVGNSPAFHWLLIHPHPTNGLEVTEFCTSTNCWNLFWTEQ
jgi:hypothetical protein